MRSLADHSCTCAHVHMLGRPIDRHVARTMHFPAISLLFARPACIGPAMHRGNAFVTKRVLTSPVPIRQRCGRIDALPRAQRRRGNSSYTTHPYFFCSAHAATCYVLRANDAATRRSRTLTTSHALPRARGHPRRSLGDPAGQGSLCRAACVQRAARETRQSGCGLGATDAWGDAHLSTAVVWISSMYLPFIHTACLPSKPRTISMRKKSLHITDLPVPAGDGRFVS